MEYKWIKPTESLPPLVLDSDVWQVSHNVLICTDSLSGNYRYEIAFCMHSADKTVWSDPISGYVIRNENVRYWREIEPAPRTDD